MAKGVSQGQGAAKEQKPYSGPELADIRKSLSSLVTGGLLPYNVAEKGGDLLKLSIVTSRLKLGENASEEQRVNAYAEALTEVLKEAVEEKILFGRLRRLLRCVLPLLPEYVGEPIQKRRKAAGEALMDKKKAVKAGTIRTYYEPEMEADARGETPPDATG
jgi:hypothetical protein